MSQLIKHAISGSAGPSQVNVDYLDNGRNDNITATSVGISWVWALQNSVSGYNTQVYAQNFTVDSSKSMTFTFGVTVESLQAVTWEQDIPGSGGTWSLETLSGGVWTANAATVVLGTTAAYKAFLIDAANRANVDAFRFVGVSGTFLDDAYMRDVRAIVLETS